MKKFLLAFTAILTITFSAQCSVTIAVLPYTVTYQGNIPKKMTAEERVAARAQDSENYQTAMIEQLTRMAKKKKYLYLDINILGQVQIDAMLRKNGIDTLVSTLTNAELAEALGVTHVVRGTVNRIFIMSDGAAMGVGAIGVLTGSSVNTATSSLTVRNSLDNAETDEIMYSRQVLRTTKVTRPDQRALRGSFRQASRRMLRNIKSDE